MLFLWPICMGLAKGCPLSRGGKQAVGRGWGRGAGAVLLRLDPGLIVVTKDEIFVG